MIDFSVVHKILTISLQLLFTIRTNSQSCRCPPSPVLPSWTGIARVWKVPTRVGFNICRAVSSCWSPVIALRRWMDTGEFRGWSLLCNADCPSQALVRAVLCDIQPWVSDHSMYYLAKREVAQVCMISDFTTWILYKTFLPCPPETPLTIECPSVHVRLLQCSIDRWSYRALSNTLMCALCCRLGAALRALRAPVRHSEQSNTDQRIFMTTS